MLGLEAEYDLYSTAPDLGGSTWNNIFTGAAWGYALGGPWGAAFGAVAGFFSSSNSTTDNELIADAFFDYWMWAKDFDQNYRLIMGIDEVWTNQQGYEVACICELEGEPIGELDCLTGNVQYEAGITCEEVQTPVYGTYIQRHQSDGTVRAESASQVPYGNSFKSYEMPGSNHVQMKNDSNIDWILKEVFAGGSGVEYFALD